MITIIINSFTSPIDASMHGYLSSENAQEQKKFWVKENAVVAVAGGDTTRHAISLIMSANYHIANYRASAHVLCIRLYGRKASMYA